MTYILAVDPGLETGACLGFYDATTPFQLVERWQIHGGVDGYIDWVESGAARHYQEVVYEKFIFSPNEPADFSGVPIEGVIHWDARLHRASVLEQDRRHKGSLIGYPDNVTDKDQRQRLRFDWLEEHGLFRAGTGNDDSNDAVTHALVSLKLRRHMPTMRAFWPSRRGLAVAS
jgi:hypothetical protein